ncbi:MULTISPECIES: SDR family oxidoreductase [unclassified Brevundimonas]|uniref:SDR family oxidoreductase n=1 Tax=unclassified Brevundimonas TaxID=2622653 RepID=UPI0025C387DA|nr:MULTISPECIES: SDR family oxidoreductase [unclassified Brevundimonas]
MSTTLPILLIFGAGYVGEAVGDEALKRGWQVIATSRRPERREALSAKGFTAIDPRDAEALSRAGAAATHILVTTPPDAQGCPALNALSHLKAAEVWPDWIGYISSTSVYGDRQGGWAFEGDALNAASLEGARRVRAERDWLDGARGMGLTVQIFRLPGFYGPGNNILERLKAGRAKRVRKPGQIFNRVHISDVVSGLFASMAAPRPGAIYNLTDDEPAPAHEITEWAAHRLGLPLPPEVDLDDPSVSDGMRRFYLDSKRISNARAKAELGWRPRYPSYREGLESLIAGAE